MIIKNVYPISEGDYTIGFDKKFIPFDADKDKLEDRPSGSLLVEVQPFLIETNEDLILLDTGLGFDNEQGVPIIHQNIIDKGYHLEDVNIVILSHLHKDHAGGIIVHDQVSFPNAKYYIRKSEWDYAIEEDGKSYYKDMFLPLADTDQLEFIMDDQGEIIDNVFYEHSGGHSPYHMVIRIEGENQYLFYGGDEAPQSKQMKTRYVAKYDYDGKKALALREEYYKRGLEEDWFFLFYHDTKSPAIKFS